MASGEGSPEPLTGSVEQLDSGVNQSGFPLEASFRRLAQKPLQWPLSGQLGKKDNSRPQLFIFVKKQNIVLCVAGYFACMCVCARVAQRGQKGAMNLGPLESSQCPISAVLGDGMPLDPAA